MWRRAFTLIEVMVVVAVMGLLAAATAWSLAEAAAGRSIADSFDRIAHADRTARIAARRLGEPCKLRFDLDARRIERIAPERSHALRLPRQHRISQLRIARAASDDSHDTVGDGAESGVVEIDYSSAGRSASYAVRLRWPEGEGWIAVAGMTGQVIRIDEDTEIDNLFALLATGRADAR